MKTSFAKLRQRGYGLIEVILAIAITLGLIVGGIVLFNQSQIASNTTDASRAIVSISSESRALYRTAPDFTGLDADQLIAAGAIAANLVVNDGTNDSVVLPYQGTLTVAASSTDPLTFDITVDWGTDPSSNAQALCTRLSAPTSEGGVGPLGTGYSVTDSDCTDGTLVANFVR